MSFITNFEGRLIINFCLFKLKFNLRFNTNKIYLKLSNGDLKLLSSPPKGVKVKFHGSNSKSIFSSLENFVNCVFHIKSNGYVEIGKPHDYKVINLRVSVSECGKLIIGDSFNCLSTCITVGSGDGAIVKIGNGCMFSDGVYIRNYDSHDIFDLTTHECINLPKEIVINDRVWIGHNSTILKGVSIPSDTIIGTNSTVTKSFYDSNTIIAGMPAKVVKKGVYWKR